MTTAEFLASVLGTLATVFGLVATTAAWTAVSYLKVKRLEAEKKIEELNRKALFSAARTGVNDALQLDPNASDQAVRRAAIEHMQTEGSPDAVKAFSLTPDGLGKIVTATIREERAKTAVLNATEARDYAESFDAGGAGSVA